MNTVALVEEFQANLADNHGETLFDELPDVRFFVKDAVGRYMKVNRALVVVYGFSEAEQLLGLTSHDFIPRHIADQYVKDDKAVLAGESVWNRVELSLRHHGCEDWFVTTKVPLRSRSGQIVGLAGISRFLREAPVSEEIYFRLAPSIEYIRQHCADRLTIDELAKKSHMSVRQFQREFRKLFDMTLSEYLRRFRIGKAVEMLVYGNDTLMSIALETGFSDHSHLTREFRRVFDFSPREYRRRYRHF